MKKYLSRIVLAVLLCLIVQGGLFAAPQPEDFTLTVVSTTDVHGYGLTPTDKNIGFSRLAGFVDMLRAEGEDVLLLDSGDIFAGNATTNLDKGMGTIEALNAVKYDAGTMGNHATDFGYKRLLELKEEMKYPFLAANVFYNDELIFEPYKIMTIKGVNIALVGICTPEYGAKEFVYEDPVVTMNRIMPELKKKAGVIIVMAHLGQEREFTASRLAENVDGIDLILDGHDHVPTPEGTRVNGALIVNPGPEMQKIGYIRLALEKGKVASSEATLLDMTDERIKNAERAEVKAVLDTVNARAAEILQKPLATSPVDLVGERGIIRKDDTNLGRLVTDAFRADSGADIALMNAGWIRAGASAGVITMQDVLNILAMGGSVVTLPVSGQDLKAAMELSFSIYPEINGNFFQVSGMTFDADVTKAPGSRISNVLVNGKPLEVGTEYSVAVLDILTMIGKMGRSGAEDAARWKPFAMFGADITSINSASSDALADYLVNTPDAFKMIEKRRINIKQ